MIKAYTITPTTDAPHTPNIKMTNTIVNQKQNIGRIASNKAVNGVN